MSFNDPTTQFHMNSDGLTLTDGLATVFSDCFKFKIQKGLAVVIPGQFIFIAKLYDNTTPDEMPADTEFAFGYLLPGHGRTIPIGKETLYQPWRRLTTTQQSNDDYKQSLIVSLGIGVLALREDETFVVQVKSATGTLDASECELYIPYAEGSPSQVGAEIIERVRRYGA